MNFKVNRHTLIPRPETEMLVEYVLTEVNHQRCNILDIGTGSGAIACAIASERKQWTISASDISQDALAVAKANAASLQLSNINFIQSDLFAAFGNQKFDVIISNPPYVAQHDPHLIDLTYEPQSALVAADNGLALLKKIIAQANLYLTPSGLLLVEHGFDQAFDLQQFCQTSAMTWVKTLNDLAGLPRVSVFMVTP